MDKLTDKIDLPLLLAPVEVAPPPPFASVEPLAWLPTQP